MPFQLIDDWTLLIRIKHTWCEAWIIFNDIMMTGYSLYTEVKNLNTISYIFYI